MSITKVEELARKQAKLTIKQMLPQIIVCLLLLVTGSTLSILEAFVNGFTWRFCWFVTGPILSLGMLSNSVYGSFIVSYMQGRIDEATLVQAQRENAR